MVDDNPGDDDLTFGTVEEWFDGPHSRAVGPMVQNVIADFQEFARDRKEA